MFKKTPKISIDIFIRHFFPERVTITKDGNNSDNARGASETSSASNNSRGPAESITDDRMS